MANIVMNGTTFNGLPNGTGSASAWQPTKYIPRKAKIGITLEAADGTRNRVERSTAKLEWEIGWTACNNATRLTLATLCALNTTFTFTDLDGNSFTAFIEEPFAPEWSFNAPSGATYWNCEIVVRQV